MFAISVLVFVIFFAIPGIDPARQMAGRNPTPETIKAIKHEFGLDRPLPVQYVLVMKHLLITRDLRVYSNRGVRGDPPDRPRDARDALADHRRGGALGGAQHRHRRGRGAAARARSGTRC